ncbi:hypothetical protein OH768_27685 [Streptomyces sp. NBC_01622]|uniref:hypothetical protein n=1 Tax=Streptomyces sp. NBC_01622 TaxID=2975903 RepID=UPI003867ACFF|nr:hypothetical protein OH768_27685 [Streptomyces sp. NBC_01622]
MNPVDVVRFMVRRVCPDSVPPTALPTDAAAAIYDTFVPFLRDSTRTLLVVTLSGHLKWTTTGVIAAGALAAVLADVSGPAAGHEDRAAAP